MLALEVGVLHYTFETSQSTWEYKLQTQGWVPATLPSCCRPLHAGAAALQVQQAAAVGQPTKQQPRKCKITSVPTSEGAVAASVIACQVNNLHSLP